MTHNANKHAHYTSGHTPAVLRTHGWRTVANSAQYIQGHLRPNMKILDVGCGPGSITVDLATYVPQGHVTGVENVEAPLTAARAHAAERGVKNVDFMIGDAFSLPFPDHTFDLTHAHQVLQHTGDPIRTLREMRRVTKHGGLVACREGDHGTWVWYPDSTGLTGFHRVVEQLGYADGREPRAGRRLHVWAREAGFDPAQVITSTGTWCFYTRAEREYWGGSMGKRVLDPGFIESAVGGGFAERGDLDKFAQAWGDWVDDDDGWISVTSGEIICRV